MEDVNEAARLSIELAKLLIQEMQAMSTPWRKAFLRLEIHDDRQGAKGSYVLDDEVHIFNVLKHQRMFAAAHELAQLLREATSNEGRKWCLALLVVDSHFNYTIEYEREDRERWEISKLNGKSGLPEGYAA